ncbi:MAG: hydantoinase B/oxoprolinase family protein [Hyphomicrobiales bacterium]
MTRIARVATDVGGTFTDLVYFETDSASGRQAIRTAKGNSTPPDFERGIFDVLAKAEVDLPRLDLFAHGTTVVINALTEGRGVRTALISTEGFRDILEIGRGNRPAFFDLNYKKPDCFVPRHLRGEVAGRMTYRGEETSAVDLAGLPAMLDRFRRDGVAAIAVCLLHAYANPAHERAVLAAIARLWPEVRAVASHQITREWREYERSSTTVLSAYVQPIAERYLARLHDGMLSRGFGGPLYVMQSNCGVDSLAATKAIPITMVESGPASGFWAAAELGRLIGEPNVLALDIGGTTAKCSLIEDGEVKIKTDYWIERDKRSAGYPVMVPVVDLVEIGSGGGSIAWVDGEGKLHVGPRSAGASPGPAAYGGGGTAATTTDANLALGRINKDFFCGGAMTADMPAVDAALQRLADELRVTPIEAARGVIRIANNDMINALKLVSINRGHDPRDFTLVAFGGGGGLHAAALARELGVRKVVIPRDAAVFSAWGMMMSDLRRDYFVTRLIETDGSDMDDVAARLGALVGEVSAHALAQFKAEAIGEDRTALRALVKCRYQNQEHPVEVALPAGPVTGETVAALLAAFHQAYEREFTYCLDAQIEIVGLHLIATAAVGKLEFLAQPRTGATSEGARKGTRAVDFAAEGRHVAAIYDAARLEPGMGFRGPAVIEDTGTTIVVHPGHQVTIDDYGNTHIDTQAIAAGGALRDAAADPFTLDVIQQALGAVADEMFAVFRRTAMSPIIYEVLDVGTGITDADGNMVSSGAGIPGFIGVLDKAVKRLLELIPAETIRPGDIFITNDPYYGGVTHLNDAVLAMPVFAGDRLVAWTANIGHWSDVGGSVPGSMAVDAHDIYAEGLRLPAIKLIDAGRPVDQVLAIMTANSRLPDFLRGDLWAAIASLRKGHDRIVRLVETYGHVTFAAALVDYFDYAERQARNGLKRLPKGHFPLQQRMDDGAIWRGSIDIADDSFTVDLRDAPDQRDLPFNTSRDGALVAAQLIFKMATAPDTVSNAGSYRPLRMLTRPGSIFEAVAPAPHGYYSEVRIRLADMLWHGLASAAPERFPAGHFASICGTVISGRHPHTGRRFTMVEPQMGGWGATATRDGNSAMYSSAHGETFNCPVEIAEARYGFFFRRLALNEEAGGDGLHRGGRGLVAEYEILGTETVLSAGYTRAKEPVWGLAGGRPGTTNRIEIFRTDGSREVHAFVSGVRLQAGDIVRITTAQGGGWGAPVEPC